ncbi:MAG: 4Fe-4S binding protein [Deltaproteobacteria bacterium]|nr:4Fe-4S binding protein [Deltaproteobacteria bacterium]
MLNIIDITKLMAVWGKAPLKIYPHQCLPLRSPKSHCRVCVEQCPAGAIKITQDSIKAADDRCTGCGVCSSLCPTGVFEMTNLDSDSMFARAKGLIARDKRVKIECYKVPFENSLSGTFRIPCLAHITPGLILRFVSIGLNEIAVRDAGICRVCESRCGDNIAKDAVSKTQRLLENLGLQQRLSMITEGISINNLVYEGERLKDYKDDPELSRREIFSVFKKETIQGVSSLIKGESPLKTAKGKDGLKKTIPKGRNDLLKALEVFSSACQKRAVTSSIFPVVAINSGCNMCRLCFMFCPTDALALEDTENGQAIVFKTTSCVGCNLCVDICAKGALNLETKEVYMEHIVKRNKETVVWFDKTLCSDCGRVFAKIKSENICDTCLKEREVF